MDNHDNVTWISCNNLAVQDKINFIRLKMVRHFSNGLHKKSPLPIKLVRGLRSLPDRTLYILHKYFRTSEIHGRTATSAVDGL